MSLSPKLSNAAANAEIDALTALLNGGFMDLYDGVQAADADTAVGAQVRLASLGFGSPAFGAGVDGVATANPLTPDSAADATGNATWYRCTAANHTTVVCDGSVGLSGANLNMNSNAIQVGAAVSVSAFALTASKT